MSSQNRSSELQLELLKKVLQKTEETHDSFKDLRKDLDLHIQKTEFELKGIKELDAKQNEILQEHHDRSIQLKRDNDLREQSLKIEISRIAQRVGLLEEPRKVLISLAKWFVWFAGVLTAAVAVYKALN
jgi:hypothetical protein